MKVLYIDTTTSYLYTGIVVDGKLLSEVKEEFGRDLSSFALKKVSEMLSSNHLEPEDIDKIMVVNGPGSFTGIRVGVTIPVVDARRSYVYGAIYTDGVVPVLKPQYISLDALKCAVDHLFESYQYVSNQNFLDLDIENYDPDIEKIVNTLSSREGINPHAVNPIYIKLIGVEYAKKSS